MSRPARAGSTPRRRVIAAGIAVVMALAVTSTGAHINSPHIYVEREIGGYPAVAIVHLPSAIPGEAELQLRLMDLRRDENVRVRVRDIPPQGEAHAPDWKIADPSDVDRNFFTAPVPLMLFGVWNVEIEIEGDREGGKFRIPVPAKRPNPGTMGAGLATFLGALLLVLLVTAWRTLTVLVRDATVREGDPTPPEASRRARRAAIVGVTIVIAWIGFIGVLWLLSHRGISARGIPALEPAIALPEGPLRAGVTKRITLEVRDRRGERVTALVPDHGKGMHATLVRVPGADVMAHLHPKPLRPGVFSLNFNPPKPGRYRLLADVLEDTGEPQTLSAMLEAQPGGASMPFVKQDDEDGLVVSQSVDEAWVGAVTSDVGDGLVLRWLDPDPVLLESGEFHRLTFQLEDEAGRPVDALEPLLDTRGHLLVLKHDGNVWAHLYPSGTLGRATALPGLGGPGRSEARVAFPYGFPEAGRYRCWVKVRYGGAVRIGTFDVDVR